MQPVLALQRNNHAEVGGGGGGGQGVPRKTVLGPFTHDPCSQSSTNTAFLKLHCVFSLIATYNLYLYYTSFWEMNKHFTNDVLIPLISAQAQNCFITWCGCMTVDGSVSSATIGEGPQTTSSMPKTHHGQAVCI